MVVTAVASAREYISHGDKATPAGGHGQEPPGAGGASRTVRELHSVVFIAHGLENTFHDD